MRIRISGSSRSRRTASDPPPQFAANLRALLVSIDFPFVQRISPHPGPTAETQSRTEVPQDHAPLTLWCSCQWRFLQPCVAKLPPRFFSHSGPDSALCPCFFRGCAKFRPGRRPHAELARRGKSPSFSRNASIWDSIQLKRAHLAHRQQLILCPGLAERTGGASVCGFVAAAGTPCSG